MGMALSFLKSNLEFLLSFVCLLQSTVLLSFKVQSLYENQMGSQKVCFGVAAIFIMLHLNWTQNSHVLSGVLE